MQEDDHKCGICVANSLVDAYNMEKYLQHRGRETAGIAAIGDTIDAIKWKGTVDAVGIKGLSRLFPADKYHTFLGHIRYATRGKKTEILKDAHPFAIGGTIEDCGNHVIINDADAVIVHNGQVDSRYFEDIDKSRLTTDCDSEALLHFFMENGENGFMKKISGAYTCAIADKRRKEVLVMRDSSGIKPGVLGKKLGKYGAASEDIAFRMNHGEAVEDLEPGCVYYIAPNGSCNKKKIAEPNIKYCFFEYNYIANVDTILNGVSVKRVREIHGETLAEEINKDDVDIVTFLPECPEVAARRYAQKTSTDFMEIFYKVKSERAFQGSNLEERAKSIKNNLFLLPCIEDKIKDKVVLSIDDSTIRANNVRRARSLLYEKGRVKKAYHVNYTPMMCIESDDGILHGCRYGVDMPVIPPIGEEYVARGRKLDEISKIVGMETLYISVEGMLKGFEKAGIPREDLCTFCIGGKRPF